MRFDRHEIAAVWNLALVSALETRRNLLQPTGDSADGISAVLEAFTYSPDLGVAIVDSSVEAGGAILDLLAAGPDIAAAILEASGMVFEALVKIVVTVLEGLSL